MTYISNTDPDIAQAIRIIANDYGDTVSVVSKKKNLIKFGRNTNVQTTASTVMTLPGGIFNETYATDNLIDSLSSTSTSDANPVTVEGHTLSGTDLTFTVQNATLNGQTKVSLSTPLARMTRLYNISASDFTGTIFGFDDTSVSLASGTPDLSAQVHLMVPTGTNQSEKASTTISSVDYWIVTSIYASLLNKTSAFADVQLQTRNYGKVFRTQADIGVSSNGGLTKLEFKPYLIIPSNSDVRLVASASANGTDVSGGIEGYLAIVV